MHRNRIGQSIIEFAVGNLRVILVEGSNSNFINGVQKVVS
jgi:hypothetical protein